VFPRPAQTIGERRWGASITLGPRCVPDACAELLDNAQALNVNTRAFKRVQKMVEDEKSL